VFAKIKPSLNKVRIVCTNVRDQCCEGTGSELVHHPTLVILHRSLGDRKLSRDLFRLFSAAQELQYLFLPL
jgi:hypothetical protein